MYNPGTEHVGKPKLWHIPVTVFTGVLYYFVVLDILLNELTSECTVNLELSVSVTLYSHSGNYSPFSQRRYKTINLLVCVCVCVCVCVFSY
jgi:hypothetical protein